MCLPCGVGLACLPGVIPFIWLFSMPFYGSFFGVDVVLRLSLMLCIHAVLAFVLSKFHINEPLIQTALVVAMVVTPVTFMPPFLIWLYGNILHVSEPVWLVCEVLGLLQLVRGLTTAAMEHIDEHNDKAKAVILTVSVTSYLLSGITSYHLLTSDTQPLVKWSLLMTLSLCLLLHIVMWFATEGVISDVAFVTLCSVGAVYFIHQESHTKSTKIDPPESWIWIEEQSSVVQMLMAISRVGIESTRQAVTFIKQLLCPGFLVTASTRLYGVIISGSLLQQLIQSESDEDEITEDWETDSDSEDTPKYSLPDWLVKPWRYPLLTRLAVIFVYTQLVCHYMYSCINRPDRKGNAMFVVFGDLPVGRWSQIGLLSVLYMYDMSRSQEDYSGW